jgi:hypothetical protein
MRNLGGDKNDNRTLGEVLGLAGGYTNPDTWNIYISVRYYSITTHFHEAALHAYLRTNHKEIADLLGFTLPKSYTEPPIYRPGFRGPDKTKPPLFPEEVITNSDKIASKVLGDWLDKGCPSVESFRSANGNYGN